MHRCFTFFIITFSALAVTLCASAAENRPTFYRIVSDQRTDILWFSPEDAQISWTNEYAPNPCVLESCHDLLNDWWPISYPIASNLIANAAIPTHRSYYLGFTPLPYAIPSTLPELETIFSNVYHIIETDGDIVFHHFDDGIPWPEALSNQTYHANILDDINGRLARTPTGHKKYISLTPINIDRNGLAPYKADQGDLPLPAPWDTYRFNAPQVKTAYLNYCEYMINRFDPDFLAIGIESNLLMVERPEKWPDYLELHRDTYHALTNSHPNLPVFVSLTAMELIDGYTEADHTDQMRALQDILPYSDFFGLSMHCFISALLAETVPSRELLHQVFSLSDKPIAICETSYPAEIFSIANGSLIFNGSTAKQQFFLKTSSRHWRTGIADSLIILSRWTTMPCGTG